MYSHKYTCMLPHTIIQSIKEFTVITQLYDATHINTVHIGIHSYKYPCMLSHTLIQATQEFTIIYTFVCCHTHLESPYMKLQSWIHLYVATHIITAQTRIRKCQEVVRWYLQCVICCQEHVRWWLDRGQVTGDWWQMTGDRRHVTGDR